MHTLSDCASLKIGTWNCHGLSAIKKNLAMNTNMDLMCLTEIHSWRDNDQLTVYSDVPSKTDSWSGVCLLISKRVAKYVIDSGCIGSRIVYCKIKSNITNYVVAGVYIPQRQRKNPAQADVYDELERLLDTIPKHNCVILLGDFNSRLSRNVDGYVGRWCIHNTRDSGGNRLLSIMQKFSLKSVSTYFQPKKRHTNATFLNIQPALPPSQIDYIIVSSRWSTGVRNCSTKWGLPISAHGRKYDHAFVTVMFKLRLKCERRRPRKDFSALKDENIGAAHDKVIEEELGKTQIPISAKDQLERLNKAMQRAQETLPNKEKNPNRKWIPSDQTMLLLEERKRNWMEYTDDDKKSMRKAISRSARNDYRNHVESIITDMEQANAVGKTSEVFKIAKRLASQGKTTSFTQPSKDQHGNPITSTDEQLKLWADFLENKFSAQSGEPVIELCDDNAENTPLPQLEEIEMCVKQLSKGKAAGPDDIPIEQYKHSERARHELMHVVTTIWNSEQVPDNLVLGDMIMLYKKKSKEDRSNYRALGLLNHSYKVFSMVLLQRIVPYIDPKLSDMQSGFRKGRGCRDNILILNMAINHLLQNATDKENTVGVITYIDFVAAFDSINHSYMLESLKQYEVPLKYIRLIKMIYNNAAVRVRIQGIGGTRSYSRPVPVRRGAIQGDIPSPIVFLVALDRLLKDHGGLELGLPVTPTLLLSDLEFADDAALANSTTVEASRRLTNLDVKAPESGMSISVPKTKVQQIRSRPEVSSTTESDILTLPENKKFKFQCTACEMTYPTKHGLSVHKGRWCKGRKTKKKPSRKGTVADKIVKQVKVEKFHEQLPKVKMGASELENVYSFTYLGTEIAADGNQMIALKHRADIAWGRFNNNRRVLTSTKLPVALRIRLYKALIVTTLTYGSSAWLLTTDIRKSLNNVNSKMLSSITRRSIHAEAKEPSFDVVDFVLKCRRSYLGHILRMNEERTVRRYLLELSPSKSPFIDGSLLHDTGYSSVDEMIEAARKREL